MVEIAQIKTVSIHEIEKLVGYKLSEECSHLVSNLDLKYKNLSVEERDAKILDILKNLNSNLETAGKHKKPKWESGWSENLQIFEKTKDISSLIPKYFNKHNIARWQGDFVEYLTDHFDYKLLIIFIDAILHEYVGNKFKHLYEFGCGPSYHLLRYGNFNKNINLVGLDWAKASQEIIETIYRNNLNKKIKGINFDYYNPNHDIDIPEETAIFTCSSLEQMGDDFKNFVDFLLEKKPDLCINFEPMSELLDQNNLLDYLSISYFEKRNYLNGYLRHLEMLETEGKIDIILKKRFFCGSYFIEGYSLVIWKIKK
jgi:hypothetical protein